MTKRRVDTDKIARGLGAKKRGKVYSTGGYPGAAQLAAEVRERFRVPDGGGRPTDPTWSDKRLVPVAPRTLERLQRIAQRLNEETGVRVEPMQLAAILLETTADQIEAEDLDRLVAAPRRGTDRARK
jgi:hypothetical protein